jgi:peptidoglycan-N-acetylglucosamine deacetylase
MNPVLVTSSWDDGHKYDLRLARMLEQYGLKATFYISPRNSEFAEGDLLTEQGIREIGHNFEIGSHTVTHPRLPTIPRSQAKKEIADSRNILQDITGQPVSSFCYPYGAYTSVHRQLVKDSGYRYARTVACYAFTVEDAYEAPTSLHAYSYWSDVYKIALFARFRLANIRRYRSWDCLGRAMFDHIAGTGGIFHLWGHSWEVDLHNDWERLEGLFRYIGARTGVKYVTNGELECGSRGSGTVSIPQASQ